MGNSILFTLNKSVRNPYILNMGTAGKVRTASSSVLLLPCSFSGRDSSVTVSKGLATGNEIKS